MKITPNSWGSSELNEGGKPGWSDAARAAALESRRRNRRRHPFEAHKGWRREKSPSGSAILTSPDGLYRLARQYNGHWRLTFKSGDRWIHVTSAQNLADVRSSMAFHRSQQTPEAIAQRKAIQAAARAQRERERAVEERNRILSQLGWRERLDGSYHSNDDQWQVIKNGDVWQLRRRDEKGNWVSQDSYNSPDAAISAEHTGRAARVKQELRSSLAGHETFGEKTNYTGPGRLVSLKVEAPGGISLGRTRFSVATSARMIGISPEEVKSIAHNMIAGFEDTQFDATVKAIDEGGIRQLRFSWSAADGTLITRSFYKDTEGELHVHHDYFQIPSKAAQGKGTGKKFFNSLVHEYDRIGVKSISTFANISDGTGGYAWARYGFVSTGNDSSHRMVGINNRRWATKVSEWLGAEGTQRWMSRTPEQRKEAQRVLAEITGANERNKYGIWAVSDSSFGKQILIGDHWDGYLDLRDKRQRARLEHYIGYKK